MRESWTSEQHTMKCFKYGKGDCMPFPFSPVTLNLKILMDSSRPYSDHSQSSRMELLNSHQIIIAQPFKRQPHKMIKGTQTIRQQVADKLFELV